MNNIKQIKYFFIITIFVVFGCKSTYYSPGVTNETTSILSKDEQNNLYVVINNKLSKSNNLSDTSINYSNLKNGLITSIDTRNPLKIMLFFKEQQEIILLDNSLSETRNIALISQLNSIVDLVCLSNRDNSFWIYSGINQELLKVDKNLKTINLTKNIGQLIDMDITPIQMVEYNNSVYLLDQKFGIFLFDLYGNYIKRIPLQDAKRFKIYPEGIIYLKKDALMKYEFKSFNKTLILKLNTEFSDFEVINNTIFGIKD